MKRFDFGLAGIVLLFSLMGSSAARADLAKDVDALLADAAIAKSLVGVEIVRLGASAADCKVLYRHNGDLLLAPASNLKLLTTSTALDRLGVDFKFRTQLVFHNGDLILIGDGDPAFGDVEMLSRVGWDVDTVFKNWAGQIKTLNLGPIKNIVVDDSIFDSDFFHPNWSEAQRWKEYEAEVAGMNLNFNCIDFYMRPNARTGQPISFLTDPAVKFLQIKNLAVTGPRPVEIDLKPEANEITLKGEVEAPNQSPNRRPIHDPPLFAVNVLAQTLGESGILYSGNVHRDRTLRNSMKTAATGDAKDWTVIGINQTPLSLVIGRANKDSANLYGECLCKRLGAESTGQPGSWQNGTAAVGEFLTRIGISASEFHLDDGCGLSKENRITASAMARVLIHNYFSPYAKVFTDSLAVAGVDGTLLDRFRGSNLRGRVFAKTGTIDGVSCLSGYLHARDNQWYAFSILVNKGAGRAMQEAVVTAIDNSTTK